MKALAAIAGLWLLTGFYVVGVDEQAVVRRFGAVRADRVPPGLHAGLPWGIDRVDRLKVREQKRITVGFEAPDAALGTPADPSGREFFTGDENLVNVEVMLQYTIRDPRAYLLGAVDPVAILRQCAEAALASAAAERPVDALLTTGKLEAQEAIRRRTQDTADLCGLGVSVTAASIQSVSPPLKVADAFRDVASAREDRDRLVKEAESYANAARPAAEGEASRLREDAAAYRERVVHQATGDAARFVRAYEEYRRAPGVTTARLYLETVEEILPRLKIVTVDRKGGKAPVDLNLLPRAPDPARPEPEGATDAPDTGATPGSPR